MYNRLIMPREQTIAIKLLLFAAGFTILSLEILGIRILGPFVGTSAPVWVALIGTTLAGSAIGYYCGGVLADRTRRKELFLWIAVVASACIMLIPALRIVVSAIAQDTFYGIGALVGSILLFLTPVTLLSMLVTYTIRVFTTTLDTIAQTQSDLYALATIGSVVGVFGTSYVLIPLLTIPSILYLLGALIFLFGTAVSFPIILKQAFSDDPKTSAN